MPRGQLDFEALVDLPALFVEETSGKGAQVARVGAITGARISGRNVVLDYTFDLGIPAVPNSALRGIAAELDIGDAEFSRTHWSVKNSDLCRALLRNSQPRRQRPKAFQLPELADIEPSLMSAMMPCHHGFDAVFAALRCAAETAGLRCQRADDLWENPAAVQDVVSLIDRSCLIVCDCTGRDPNVFYEIGIAHALGREVILITQAEPDIPCDLRHLGFVHYVNNGEGLNGLCEHLKPRLSELAVGSSSTS